MYFADHSIGLDTIMALLKSQFSIVFTIQIPYISIEIPLDPVLGVLVVSKSALVR